MIEEKCRNNIGKRVRINALPTWLKTRVEHGYCLVRLGMIGTIVGVTNYADKYAVEFDEPIFIRKSNGEKSSYDTGCHGKGKKSYCAYFLPGHVAVEFEGSKYPWEGADNRLLLLLL